ncbi:MAG TPA: hypothetical protein VFS23_33140 [Vicinamibacterales bacterium]|nr:hypothetical protein [Vicinamibacterales bacterium]
MGAHGPNKTSFKKGNCAGHGAPKGNKNAAKDRLWRKALDTALAQYEDQGLGIKPGEALQRIATECVKDALSIDPDVRLPARNEIANRLDGKPKESIDVTAEFTHRLAEELTDEELAGIIREARSSGSSGSNVAASGGGADSPPPSAQDDSIVH